MPADDWGYRYFNDKGILSAIPAAFAGADSDDVSLFYFSGHGATNYGWLVGTSGYVTPAQLHAALDKIPGTKAVLLDCCSSGAFINKDGTEPSPSAFNSAVIGAFAARSKGSNDLAANGCNVLTVCSKTQKSASASDDGNYCRGAFTCGICYSSGYDLRFKRPPGRPVWGYKRRQCHLQGRSIRLCKVCRK